MTTQENDISIEVYTPEEVELLNKYGAKAEGILDDEEIYEIITKNEFNDEKIESQIKQIVQRIKAKGDDYLWGSVENGKKKLAKEQREQQADATKGKKQQGKENKTQKYRGQKPTYKKTNRVYPEETDKTNVATTYRTEYDSNLTDKTYGSEGYQSYTNKSNYNSYRGGNSYYNNYNSKPLKRPYKSKYTNDKPELKKEDDFHIEYIDGKQVVIYPNKVKTEHEKTKVSEDTKEDTTESIVINEIATFNKGKKTPEKKKSPVKHNYENEQHGHSHQTKTHNQDKHTHDNKHTHGGHKHTPVKKDKETIKVETSSHQVVGITNTTSNKHQSGKESNIGFVPSSAEGFHIESTKIPTKVENNTSTTQPQPFHNSSNQPIFDTSKMPPFQNFQPPFATPNPGFYGFPNTYPQDIQSTGNQSEGQTIQPNPMCFFPMIPFPYYYYGNNPEQDIKNKTNINQAPFNQGQMPMNNPMMYQQMMYKYMMDMSRQTQEDPNNHYPYGGSNIKK
jgi:hypothetical protein